jgi:hypothetical protein
MRTAAGLAVVQARLAPGGDDARWGRQCCPARPSPTLVGVGAVGPGAPRGRNDGGRRGRRSLGRRGLGRPGSWRGLVGRVRTLQPVAFRPPADAVGLGLLDARGMARNPYTHRQGELQALFVSQAELSCQFVYPDFLGQVLCQSLCSSSLPPPLVATPSLSPILACSEAVASSSSTSPARMSARKARLKAPRRAALVMQPGSANSFSPSLQSQAPRPGPFR